MKQVKKSNKGIGKRMLVFFCCLLFIVTVLVCGASISLYRSHTEGTSKGTIASFAWSSGATNGSNTLEIDCNTDVNTTTYNFWVKNEKDGKVMEVDAEYSVTVNLSAKLPTGVTMKLDGADGAVSNSGKTYTFTDSAWAFKAGVDESNEHSLVFTADPSAVVGNTTISDIIISVTIEQID